MEALMNWLSRAAFDGDRPRPWLRIWANAGLGVGGVGYAILDEPGPRC